MEIVDLLKCAIQVIAKVAMPPEKIREVIGDRKKQLKAYNLCDGMNSLVQIAKKAKIDQGNFSRTASRWIEHGIIFSVGEGSEKRLLHVYPLPKKD
jgi:hypothetical protein